MAYKAGEARLITRQSLIDDYLCDPTDPDEDFTRNDSRGHTRIAPPYVELPHSCDAWVIGGAAEIRAMIADLTAALASIETTSDEGGDR